MELAAESPSTTSFTMLEYNPGVCVATYGPNLPPNVSLQQFNLLEDFVHHPEWKDHFDLVNERLLFFAWTPTNWIQVLQSYFSVLKPGGYLQLWEIDMTEPEFYNLGHCYKVGAKYGRQLTEKRGIKPDVAKDLPTYLAQTGYEVVSNEAFDFDFSHVPKEPEPIPGTLGTWYRDTSYAICRKPYELGMMSQEEWDAFEEGIKDEWEKSDKKDWKFRARLFLAKVKCISSHSETADSFLNIDLLAETYSRFGLKRPLIAGVRGVTVRLGIS